MISHKHKCIFVEIPKTGTSSIRSIIGKPLTMHLNIWQIKCNMEHYWTSYEKNIINRFMEGLYLFLPVGKREKIGREQFDSYFKFSFVRNPWARVVSLYNRNEGLMLKNKMSFDEFVHWIKYSSSTCVLPVPHRYQLDWLVDPHGNVLVDFIGKFENIQNDWEHICDKTGIKERKLPHENKNPRNKKHYSEYYNEKTKDIIGKQFDVDIEYFGYEFG